MLSSLATKMHLQHKIDAYTLNLEWQIVVTRIDLGNFFDILLSDDGDAAGDSQLHIVEG